MPIYEYLCQKCKERFDYFQAINDPPKTACERCGGELEKLISASGFILKGGGWYKDLYSSSKPEKSGKPEPSGQAGTSSSDSSSSSSSGNDKKS